MKRALPFVLVALVTAVFTFGVAWLLTTIFEHREEAKNPYIRFVDVNDNTTDPEQWGKNWPREFDGYQRTVDVTATNFGGSESSPPESRLAKEPWLKRMFAGYAFAIDFNVRRGHAYMLFDQEQTKRITEVSQPGACLNCHASLVPTFRRLGLEAQGKTLADANGFDWPAVMDGFKKLNAMSYVEAHAELEKTPDGSAAPGRRPAIHRHRPGRPRAKRSPSGWTSASRLLCRLSRSTNDVAARDPARIHPWDSGWPAAMSRPRTCPASSAWHRGDRSTPYDPNTDASRQEMRPSSVANAMSNIIAARANRSFSRGGRACTSSRLKAFTTITSSPTEEHFTISNTPRPERWSTKPSIRNSRCGARAFTRDQASRARIAICPTSAKGR